MSWPNTKLIYKAFVMQQIILAIEPRLWRRLLQRALGKIENFKIIDAIDDTAILASAPSWL